MAFPIEGNALLGQSLQQVAIAKSKGMDQGVFGEAEWRGCFTTLFYQFGMEKTSASVYGNQKGLSSHDSSPFGRWTSGFLVCPNVTTNIPHFKPRRTRRLDGTKGKTKGMPHVFVCFEPSWQDRMRKVTADVRRYDQTVFVHLLTNLRTAPRGSVNRCNTKGPPKRALRGAWGKLTSSCGRSPRRSCGRGCCRRRRRGSWPHRRRRNAGPG